MQHAGRRLLALDAIAAVGFFAIYLLIAGFQVSTTMLVNLSFVLLSHIAFVNVALAEQDNVAAYSSGLFVLNVIYIIAATVVCIVLSLIPAVSLTAVIVVHLIVLTVAMLLILSTIFRNRRNTEADANDRQEYRFINQMIYFTLQIQTSSNSTAVKEKCTQILDYMRSSQYRSSPSVFTLEETIRQQLNDIAIGNNEDSDGVVRQLDGIMALLKQRNELLARTDP